MLKARAAVKTAMKPGLRLKAVQLFSLAEPELARLIARAESDPLFEKIRPFVRRLPFQSTRFHLPSNEEASLAGRDPLPWSEHERELELIRRVGHERFERHFLAEAAALSAKETALACGLSPAEVRTIRQFLLTLSLHSHAMTPGSPLSPPHARCTCLAKVLVAKGKPELNWMLPQLAKGRYAIDYQGLRDFKASRLSADERKRLNGLLGSLELINIRHNGLLRVIQAILVEQTKFLKTRKREDLKPLTAAALARRLGLHPSTVGRIARGRSLLMPWNEELTLDFLLPNPRRIAVYALSVILEQEDAPTDEKLRRALLHRFGIHLSRRTVNECRREAAKI